MAGKPERSWGMRVVGTLQGGGLRRGGWGNVRTTRVGKALRGAGSVWERVTRDQGAERVRRGALERGASGRGASETAFEDENEDEDENASRFVRAWARAGKLDCHRAARASLRRMARTASGG